MTEKTVAAQVTPIAFAAALATLVVGLARYLMPDIQGAIPGAEGALTTVFAAIYIKTRGSK